MPPRRDFRLMHLVLWVLLVIYLLVFRPFEPEISREFQAMMFKPLVANNLSLGSDAKEGWVEIELNEPAELDFLDKSEIFEMRKAHVMKYHELVRGDYTPSSEVFRIADDKPWWGLEGQYCIGGGDNSIWGPSEESRFIMNPFLLLSVDNFISYEGWSEDAGCFPVYPRPISLLWNAFESKAIVTYNMTRFFNEKESVELYFHTLHLANLNARDFGFNFVYADFMLSTGINYTHSRDLLTEPVMLRNFIQLEGSCRYPGGCNNGVPNEPALDFDMIKLPATLHCKLWRNRPEDPSEPADFTYAIDFV